MPCGAVLRFGAATGQSFRSATVLRNNAQSDGSKKCASCSLWPAAEHRQQFVLQLGGGGGRLAKRRIAAHATGPILCGWRRAVACLADTKTCSNYGQDFKGGECRNHIGHKTWTAAFFFEAMLCSASAGSGRRLTQYPNCLCCSKKTLLLTCAERAGTFPNHPEKTITQTWSQNVCAGWVRLQWGCVTFFISSVARLWKTNAGLFFKAASSGSVPGEGAAMRLCLGRERALAMVSGTRN